MDDGIACAPAAPVRVSLANRGLASRPLPFAELQGVACLSVPVTPGHNANNKIDDDWVLVLHHALVVF